MRELHDSGIEWIGIAPSSWKVAYLSSVLSERKHKNVGMQEDNLLSLSYGNVKQKDINTNDGLLPESFEGYNIIEDGDIVLRLTDLQNDHRSLRTGLCRERGIITSAYCTLKRNNDKDDPRFLRYYLHCFDLCKGFYGMGAGVRQGLNFDGIRKIEVLLPTPVEQTAISDYLDAQMEKVDALIANQQAQIEKLKQYKQSLITEVVTKGLDPDAPTKASGTPWFPLINSAFEVSRVGLHFDIILGKMLCSTPPNETYTLEPYYCAADVHFEGISDTERKKMWFSPIEKEAYLVRENDLLVVEGGAGAGGSAIVKLDEEPTYIQNSIMIVRAKNEGDNRFLRYLLEMLVKSGYIDFVCNKATIPHFTKDKLSNVPYIFMNRETQSCIADFLDYKFANINALISAKNEKIERLNQYKKSLIYEYVTGKKEVI